MEERRGTLRDFTWSRGLERSEFQETSSRGRELVKNIRLVFGAGFAGAALLIFGSAGIAAKPVRSTVTQPADEAVLRARAEALIAQMTPEEKSAQLQTIFVMSVRGAPKPEDRAAGGIGSLAYVSAPAEINRLQRIAMEKSRLKIPILFGYDVVHGLRTIFPVPIATAASWDIALAERSQSIAAAEARAVGIQWAFAPMIDIARDPRWGRMVEGAGEDPYLGSAMAAAQVRGFQGTWIGTSGRVVAGPKHFAGL
jgi:beta-glucosidase